MKHKTIFTAIVVALQLSPALLVAAPTPQLPQIQVIGSKEALQKAPGSGAVLSKEDLDRMHPASVNEVLRSVPGVVMRDEEGFGLRPNIGIRGLNPTRSTKVLLLEDGLPAAYAPYGDNASYYHAPVDRYERIEVLKGVGMLRFGPQTIGGVINYITPDPTEALSGYAALTAGSNRYVNAHARLSGGGFAVDAVHKQGDGARDTLELSQTDFNVKYAAELTPSQSITARLSYLQEDSQVGYSGLTQAEFEKLGARYGFDQNAHFDLARFGASLTHQMDLSDRALLSTNAYIYQFDRDWWRQSSTTTDTQCGTAFRDARFRGERVNFDACAAAQGRLRSYQTFGVEPRVTLFWDGFGAESELEFGLRAHDEQQERRQVNATAARGRDGVLVENNRRTTRAYSGFVSNTFQFGGFALVPAVRIENIRYTRSNRLTARSGDDALTRWIPGLGVNYALTDQVSMFAGVHRGFAPPRAEDVIDNAGGSVEIEPEDSRNFELGLRRSGDNGLTFEAAVFRNHFLRQIAVGSVAGGNTPLATGEGTYQGFELMGQFERADFLAADKSYLNLALTLLPTARQDEALRGVVSGIALPGSAAGKRLPYAPKSTLTLRLGQQWHAWDASIEGVYVARQFSDFGNVIAADASGQFGLIAAYTIANATVTYAPKEASFLVFATAKNLFDRDYIVDRTRGIQVGPERQIQIGVRFNL
jgi:Fe(3+) dicitrate transport protein